MWHTVHHTLHRLARRIARRDDRGDVPGWVLITLMTAALVGVIWTVAGNDLTNIFHNAVCNATSTNSTTSGPGADCN